MRGAVGCVGRASASVAYAGGDAADGEQKAVLELFVTVAAGVSLLPPRPPQDLHLHVIATIGYELHAVDLVMCAGYGGGQESTRSFSATAHAMVSEQHIRAARSTLRQHTPRLHAAHRCGRISPRLTWLLFARFHGRDGTCRKFTGMV